MKPGGRRRMGGIERTKCTRRFTLIAIACVVGSAAISRTGVLAAAALAVTIIILAIAVTIITLAIAVALTALAVTVVAILTAFALRVRDLKRQGSGIRVYRQKT